MVPPPYRHKIGDTHTMTRLSAIAHQTAAALRTIRGQWGDLLVAIETPPAEVWPPRQLTHTLNATADVDEPLLAKAPLVLREYPAPANLAALDAGLAIEEALFDLADVLATACQRTPLGDVRRWELRREISPGSRRHGLHWAAVWIEGRVLGEDTTLETELDGTAIPAPFLPLREQHQIEARQTVRECERRLLCTLGLDHRDTPIPDRPCPWCAGQLTLHSGPDIPPAVTCATGPSCTAPVLTDDRGHRVWRWRDLPALAAALDAGEAVHAAKSS
ncbi:hypothetical protein T261_5807 [Streptomyces lydicus]|nr:hypothetical protein T261_5807 [Streptomyces lydicus]